MKELTPTHEHPTPLLHKDTNAAGFRKAKGLYDPAYEHDACGVGFVANIKGEKSHDIVLKGIEVLQNLTHRGACGCDGRPTTNHR